jgi:hypothetical protein
MKKFLSTSALLACIALIVYVFMRETVGPAENAIAQKVEPAKPIVKQQAPVAASMRAVQPPAGAVPIPPTIARAKTPAERLRSGDRLAQLYAEVLTGEPSPSSQYIARKIVEQCLLTSRVNEATYIPINENSRAQAIISLRKLKESCAGLDISQPTLARMADQKKVALEKGDAVAMADAALILAAQGNKADAFEAGKSLLSKSPDNPDVWAIVIGMLPALDIQIGVGDEQLRRYTPAQITAATMLSSCESTGTCGFNDSLFLQNECVNGGRCSNGVMDYIREFVLPPGDMNGVSAATARLTDLVNQRRWDLLGYAEANRPIQAKPSLLPPPPSKKG